MFLNTAASYKLVPTILKPTRITELSSTLIDDIFTNSLCQDIDSCILIEDISDHLPILLFLNLNPPSTTNPVNLNKRYFNNLAKDKFIKSLKENDWSILDNLCITDGP